MDQYWRKRLTKLRKSVGMEFEDLAKKSGVARSQISMLEGGKRPFTQKTIDKLLAAMGYDYHDLFNRNKPEKPISERPIIIQAKNEYEKDILYKNHADYIGIPLYESGKLSAGINGIGFEQNENPSSIVVVYRPELKNSSSHNLVALRVGGDSMEPTITEGSIVVVDVDDKEFFDGRVYVINSCDDGLDMAAIKRIKRWDKGEGFIILSDNTKYHPDISTEDWHNLCVGRVVWMWKDIRYV